MPKELENIADLFTNKEYISLVQQKLPKLFDMAAIESSRAGKIGMQVGSLRENVLIALILYAFDKKANANYAITKSETDVEVNRNAISIKTITGNGGIKASWTVDAGSATKFINAYKPSMDIILAQIFWNSDEGGLFLIPKKVQLEVFKNLGKEYLKMPKADTNPRGIEFSKEAINKMLNNKETRRIKINWKGEKHNYNVYQRWIDYWKE